MPFYCVMLSTERKMLSKNAHPYVCPSVTYRYSVETIKSITNLFHHRVPVFRTKRYSNIPTGILPTYPLRSTPLAPSKGASNAGGMKNHDFLPISCFISGMIQDTAIVTTECEYKTAPKLSNSTIFNDLD